MVEAETICQSIGGHLASYSSEYEQYEVEQAFIRGVGAPASCQGSARDGTPTPNPWPPPLVQPQGHLLPGFHRSYWLALSRNDSLLPYLDPPFKWTDRTASGPDGNYTNWAPTPPGLPYVGYCAVAAAPATQGSGPAAAWAWQDQRCNATQAFICRLAVNVGGRPAR